MNYYMVQNNARDENIVITNQLSRNVLVID